MPTDRLENSVQKKTAVFCAAYLPLATKLFTMLRTGNNFFFTLLCDNLLK